jgi:hypothetical protein
VKYCREWVKITNLLFVVLRFVDWNWKSIINNA